MLQLVNFRKRYGSREILHIDNASFQPGIYWLQGANGSGKSTLLKSIAGLVWFDGNIIINHTLSLKERPVAYRQLVNFCEAEPTFPDFLTGYELINLFSDAKKASNAQRDLLIDGMKIDSYLSQVISTYSSGMLKKLSLVLAFLGTPSLILLDEPLNTLDSDSVRIFYSWVSALNKNSSTSFFLTSHHALDSTALPNAQNILVQSKHLSL